MTRLILRLEGGVALGCACLGYGALGGRWWLFAVLLLVPDVSMLGYLRGARVGAAVYNAAHTYLAPARSRLAGGAMLGWLVPLPMALIWTAHIGVDRLVGYGLKDAAGFGVTHLGRIGRRQQA